MWTDQDDLTELHEMAHKIGVKREWFQNNPDHPHYDLQRSKRELAARNGAKPSTTVEWVMLVREQRKRRAEGQPNESPQRKGHKP